MADTATWRGYLVQVQRCNTWAQETSSYAAYCRSQHPVPFSLSQGPCCGNVSDLGLFPIRLYGLDFVRRHAEEDGEEGAMTAVATLTTSRSPNRAKLHDNNNSMQLEGPKPLSERGRINTIYIDRYT